MIGASNTPFRVRPPQLLADSATESAANNALAGGYQKGFIRPATMARAGQSVNAKDRMRAAQQQSAGIQEGAQAAAAMRAEDQQFNSQQAWDNEMLQQQSRAFDYGQMTESNAAHNDANMARRNALAGVAEARAQAFQRRQLALISKGLLS